MPAARRPASAASPGQRTTGMVCAMQRGLHARNMCVVREQVGLRFRCPQYVCGQVRHWAPRAWLRLQSCPASASVVVCGRPYSSPGTRLGLSLCSFAGVWACALRPVGGCFLGRVVCVLLLLRWSVVRGLEKKGGPYGSRVWPSVAILVFRSHFGASHVGCIHIDNSTRARCGHSCFPLRWV